MNTCAALDFGCRFDAAIAPVIYWGRIGFIVIIILAALAGLAWVYRNFGWWGVGITASVGLSAFIFKKGVDYGKYRAPPPPKPGKPKPTVVISDRLKTPKGHPKPYINPDTGTWYDNK